jgi:DNA-binding NtrC family response regulator
VFTPCNELLAAGVAIGRIQCLATKPLRTYAVVVARILVIDDEQSVRAALRQALTTAGHTVVLAANGIEGVNLQRQEPADLIITDLFMPEQDGVETMVQLRKFAPDVGVIAISGNPLGSEMLAVAEKLGAIAIFEKPFTVPELLKAVDEGLAKRR